MRVVEREVEDVQVVRRNDLVLRERTSVEAGIQKQGLDKIEKDGGDGWRDFPKETPPLRP